ncbi:hypothetical protein [Flagellimonas amoyensis]|uniref:hypothetical protein n=1 Tax=Flagellimonas amoyensis TaxID=2169401 RepID=UPI00131F3E67|nr:hypothetical protein [Allomuricauda amoyensis]
MGQVKAFENESLPNFPVEAYASGEFIKSILFLPGLTPTQEDVDLIGASSSTPEGNYGVTTISPENQEFIYLIINGKENRDYVDDWPTLAVKGINSLPLNGSRYEIPTVAIGRIEDARFEIHRTTNTQDTLVYLLQYDSSIKEINVDPSFVGNKNWEMEIGGELMPLEVENVVSLKIPEGDTIRFYYSLINDGILTEENIKIPYNLETNGYRFEF